MAVFELLVNHGIDREQYNGRLDSFIEDTLCEEKYKEFFSEVSKIIPNAYIFVNYKASINKEIPSNVVIRYRDAFKLPEYSIVTKYIIYFKNDVVERAIILSDEHYILSKGLYCVLTEPGSDFIECREEIIPLFIEKDYSCLLKTFQELFEGSKYLISIKREYDRKYLNSVDEMKEIACDYSRDCFQTDKEVIETLAQEEKAKYIYNAVVRTFLLKKAIYVQYMSSKDLLNNRHEGFIGQQRKFATTYANDVPFIPIGRLFHPEQEYEQEKSISDD